jgi:predicted GTPase
MEQFLAPLLQQTPIIPTDVNIANFPTWTLYVIALAQIAFGLATLVLAFVAALLLRQAMALLAQANEMTAEVKGHLPSMMDSVDGSLKNAKTISDDASTTIHAVTGTVTKVSNVVGAVTGRMESPVIKAAGALAGVAAGLRSVRGKKEVVVDHDAKVVRRKRGLFK